MSGQRDSTLEKRTPEGLKGVTGASIRLVYIRIYVLPTFLTTKIPNRKGKVREMVLYLLVLSSQLLKCPLKVQVTWAEFEEAW